MIVEGVHNGSHGPLLHRMKDLGKFPQMWDGIPVTVDHPMKDGEYVSANSPGVIDELMVGRVYNTHVEGSALKAEVWLDEDRLSEVSEEILNQVNEEKKIEVSLGMYTEDEEESGDWNGETYEAIAKNHRPDHLAILPNGVVGACSIDDGCGIGANKKGDNSMKTNATVTGMEKKRKELGMSVTEFYAVPRDPPSASKLPIFDEAHVRNAMARFSQTKGLSTEEKAAAKKKIVARAKKYDIDTTGFEGIENHVEALEELQIAGYSVSLIANGDQGYRTLIDSMYSVLRGMDSDGVYHYLEEVYDDAVIYSKSEKTGNKLYKQAYKYTDGEIEFVGNPLEVRKEVKFVANSGMTRTKFNDNVNLNKEGKMKNDGKPCCEDVVNELIANERTKFVAEDKVWLLTLKEEQLAKLIPEKVDAPPVPLQVNAEVVKQWMKDSMTKLDDYLQLMPAEIQDQVKAGLKLHQERRTGMIQAITTQAKDVYTEAELKAMDTSSLEKVFKLVNNQADFSLNAGGGSPTVNEEKLLPVGVGNVEPDKK